MAEQRSALDSLLGDPSSTRPLIARKLPLILSVAGACGVAPFAVMRWATGDWPIAIIDTLIVFGFVVLGMYIYRTRRVRTASFLLTALCVVGTLVTVYMRGPQQVYWAYPAVMTSFYLIRPREALAFTAAMTGGLYLILIDQVPAFLAGTVIVTILLTTAFAFAFSVLNNRQQEQLLAIATRDSLTGSGNRHAFVGKLNDIIADFTHSATPSSLILLDVDHFKQVNDVHGHRAGDEVLRRVSQRLQSRIRVTDSLYRIGGEEFVVVIEGAGLDIAAGLAEELRERIESHELVPGIAVTVSIGVAEIREQESDEAWLHRADEALYEAKRSGRNSVRIAA